MTAICTSHYWNPLNDYVGRKGKKHLHQNRFRQRQSSRSAFYQPGLNVNVNVNANVNVNVSGSCFGEHDTKPQQLQQSQSQSQPPQETQAGHWGFRPSALQHDDYGRGEMSVSEIVDCYVKDSERAEREGVAIPPRPSLSRRGHRNHKNRKLGCVRDALFSASASASSSSSSLSTLSASSTSTSTSSVLRCLQWNIQAFSSPKDERNMHTITAGIIRSICETDSDVLVLNEIHWREVESVESVESDDDDDDDDCGNTANNNDYSSHHCEGTKRAIRSSQALLEELLRLRGYRSIMVANHGDTPTLIATRKKVLASKEIILSHNRSALCLKIEVPSDGSCWVVGTHLDAFDAKRRRSEIRTLLEEADHTHHGKRKAVLPILVMGDFNQQRRRDYTPREWERVASSADLRGVPLDDGVAGILEEAGFRCVLDDVRKKDDADHTDADTDTDTDIAATNSNSNSNKVSCNWNQARPPPSTHWSGTTIDYTYYSNPKSHHDSSTTTTPHGVYVGPAGFSDHRMTVSDWTLTTTAPPPTTGAGPAPRHIDKSFFFNHLPAGRHHSWLYNHTHRQFDTN